MALSTILAAPNKPKPLGYNAESVAIYSSERCVAEEVLNACVPPTVASPAGQKISIDMTFARDDDLIFRSQYLEWTATNTNGVGLEPSFKNLFGKLASFKRFLNGKEDIHYENTHAIMLRAEEYLRRNPQDILSVLNPVRTETGTTFAGDVVTRGATTYHRIPLHWITPLEGQTLNATSGIERIVYEIVFQQTSSTAGVSGEFITNSTDAQSYTANLTYSNIQVRTNFVRSKDARFYWHAAPQYALLPKYEIKDYTHDWSAANTFMRQIDLNTTFTKRNKIPEISVYLANITTAYNSAETGKFYSGSDYIGWKLLSRGKVLIDYSDASTAKYRQQYDVDFQRNRFGKNPSDALLLQTSDATKVGYWSSTKIDLANIENDPTVSDTLIAGYSNYDADLQLLIYSGATTLTNSVKLYVAVKYLEAETIDQRTRIVSVIS